MATFYKVVLNGSYKGKDNKNTLFYRSAAGFAAGAFGFGGARELAEEVKQEVVPSFLAFKPASYMLETIDVTPRNDAFELLYQLPYRLECNMAGTGAALFADTDGPALCINFKFNLEPTAIGPQTLTAPKRGYIAVGPVPSAWVDDEGRLAGGVLQTASGAARTFASKISSNLESIDPPAVWFPVRVSEKYGATGAGLLSWGWADVESATIDEYVSFRRSRRITG